MRVASLLIALFVSVPSAAQSDLRSQLFAEADAARLAAVEADASTLAPKTWDSAEEFYGNAARDFERGGNLNRIREGLAEARDLYRHATTVAAAVGSEHATLIRARNAAREADAYLHSASDWTAGESRFRDAMLAFERGDARLAERRADEAEEKYRAAELKAIKTSVLFEVRAELARADKERADRDAPRTFARAQALLAQAETALTEDRYDTDRPRGLAREALREARHAIHLANLVSATRGRDRTVEDLALDYETQLGAVADAAGVTPAFDAGPGPVAEALVETIARLQQRQRALETDLADRNTEILALQEQIDELDRRLGGVAEERRALAMRLEAQAEVRRRYEEIGRLFTRDDGEVLRDGNHVTLRLSGLTFDVGKADLTARHEPLLAKIRDALRLLPPEEVIIEGHTDSYGGDDINFRLSEDRANALRDYILSTMALAPNRVLAVGYGETRPVANNETKSGRARNRRIDIVIKPDLPQA